MRCEKHADGYLLILSTKLHGLKRHITVTEEGVITDLVDDKGEVVDSASVTHEEMLVTPDGDDTL
jgi:hypothetical protein